VSSEWREEPTPQTSSSAAGRMTMMYRPGTPTTRLILLDVSSDTPRLLEEATYDGNYVSARLTGQIVRLVTNNRPQVTSTQPQYNQQPSPAQQRAAERESLAANQQSAEAVSLTDVLPQVSRRNAGGTVLGAGPAVSCSQTSYAPDSAGDSTLLVTTLRPSVGLAATDSDAITTDGDLVYASENRLYVATSRWGTSAPVGGPATDVMVDPAVSSDEAQKRPAQDPSATSTAITTPSPTASPTDEVTTDLHAFDVSGETTRYVGSGAVPGYVLGRWALSEDKGVLRVATTRQPPWEQTNPSGQQAQTSSMLVKLAEQDGKLVETGRVEGLGKTERIQAVRYFGDLAAVVTFRQTYPLYLVDLAGTPKVLGELKVNGFSTYLHPLGGGLLLGLGQEADDQGRTTGTHVSVFDINDPANPRQVDRLQLGTGYSPAQDDSRAFSYDPTRRMAMFAFSAYDVRGYQGPVGALGISVSAAGQLNRVGLLEVTQNAPTQRVLYDADHVYAVSDSGVAAGDPATMTRTGQADFAGADNNGAGSTEPAPAIKR
ncbi:MAG: beta-propeller domain-containing protein, partial [Mycobacteriales bacterium]